MNIITKYTSSVIISVIVLVIWMYTKYMKTKNKTYPITTSLKPYNIFRYFLRS